MNESPRLLARRRFARSFLLSSGILVSLAACGFVDTSFPDRISTINDGYDVAVNQEILNNIVRASESRPLRFYIHSKFVPSQSTDIKVGLPTITLGPAQTATQRQFIFAANGTDNSASLSLQLDPIETRDFHSTFLTRVDNQKLALLLQNYPRELVFFLLFDSVRYEDRAGRVIEYKNNPSARSSGCRGFRYDGARDASGTASDATYDPAYGVSVDSPDYNGVQAPIQRRSPYRPPGEGSFSDLRTCQHERFVFWIEELLAYGYTFRFKSEANPRYDAADSKSTQPKTISTSYGCFDPAQAQAGVAKIISEFPNACDKRPVQPGQGTRPQPAARNPFSATPVIPEGPICLSGNEPLSPSGRGQPRARQCGTGEFSFPFQNEAGQTEWVSISVSPRSLSQVFGYLGRLASLADGGPRQTIFSAESRLSGDGELLTLRQSGVGQRCFASARSVSRSYCIPEEGADNTKQVFTILTELVSLSQAVSDVPASTTVRVTP